MRRSAVAPSLSPKIAHSFDPEFARDVLAGLAQPRKSLPCRYFYDRRGSELFEQITELEEYYPTRTEVSILRERASEIARHTQEGSALIELGSGSSRKTEILLDAMPGLGAYVAIDVCEEALVAARARLMRRFPGLRFHSILADFLDEIRLPAELKDIPKLGFFPGSTIGNLAPPEASGLLERMRRLLGPEGRFLVGVDLKKDACRLVRAYDDEKGVTAAFNLNLLARINRELGGDFDLAGFRHRARYNAHEGCIEIHLVSTRAQTARILGRTFRFAPGESIHTENSYKYTVAEFQALARAAGWLPRAAWVDEQSLFSVHHLATAD